MKDYQLKNYYMLQTLKCEISKFDIISFDIFDTLLLWKVLFPNDIFRILSQYAESQKGIVGFQYIRQSEENNARQQSLNEDVTLDEIYDRIEAVLAQQCSDLKQRELELEAEHCIQNPIMMQVYNMAVRENKTIWLLSDMYLPSEMVESLLHKNGYKGYEKLVISGEFGKAKSTGNMYQQLIDTSLVDPKKWLHIGDNLQSDVDVPRKYGIEAYYYKSLRDRYFQNRLEKKAEQEKTTGIIQPDEKEDDSIECSKRRAEEIIEYYTQTINPSIENIINVQKVSMLFNLSNEKIDNLKEYFIKFFKGELKYTEFWALRDISFSVKRGERIGLIGLNGSGKSTMLKIVSGVLKATKGTINVKGTIAPLIELGAGFDINLSARENVFLNGAILGHSRDEMRLKYDEIIDFAELHEFEDVPIKNFSSGMTARLGFAIATCHTPDVLIIDEILSVGDFAFQKKCHDKMQEMTDKGVTVLFVSHSAGDIIDMCDRAIWLDHGNVIDIGEAEYIVGKYLSN